MNYDQLKDQIKAAMKARDKNRVSILRQVLGEVKNIEVNERREITEADVNAMIKRMIKQTGETLEGSIKAANNDERTAMLTEQVDILKSLLPQQLEGAALEAEVESMIASVGAATKRDLGKVMGALNAKTGGNFDKAVASQIIARKLS